MATNFNIFLIIFKDFWKHLFSRLNSDIRQLRIKFLF
jgi:hypothetical protein